MTFFTASIGTIALRFYLMMGIIVGSFVVGLPLLAIFALPVFLGAMTGVSFRSKSKESTLQLQVVNQSQKKKNSAA